MKRKRKIKYANIYVEMYQRDDGQTVCKTLQDEHFDGFTVPAGFESDGASLPRFFWRLLGHPFNMLYLREAILHDFFYRTQIYPRKIADKLFFELLKKKMPVRSFFIYGALRIFGWIAWNHNKKKIRGCNK
jgi:hypothetical protein